MKKRVCLLVFALTLFMSGFSVQAEESKNTSVLNSYVNLFLEEVKGTKKDESASDLKESLSRLMESVKPEDAKKILAFVEEKIEEGNWENEEGIEEAIAEGEEKFGKLTQEQRNLILSAVEKIKALGIDPEFLINQAEKIYEKYSQDIQEDITESSQKIAQEAQTKIKEEIDKSLTDYFSDMVNSVKAFFQGIFKK